MKTGSDIQELTEGIGRFRITDRRASKESEIWFWYRGTLE